MDEFTRNIRYDDRLQSYCDFIPPHLGRQLLDLTRDDAQWHQIALDLLLDWRSASYTASFPGQVVEQLRAFAEGYTNDSAPSTGILRFADVILLKLAESIPALVANKQLARALYERVVSLSAEVQDANKAVKPEFPVEAIWQSHLREPVFQMTIRSSLRLCYVSVYNAFDNFVQRCTSLAHVGATVRTTSREFRKQFVDAFGEDAYLRYWMSESMVEARLVRHSLSHAGGRVTPKLEQRRHGFLLEDNVIQILPEDLKTLFSSLGQAALGLCEIRRPQ